MVRRPIDTPSNTGDYVDRSGELPSKLRDEPFADWPDASTIFDRSSEPDPATPDACAPPPLRDEASAQGSHDVDAQPEQVDSDSSDEQRDAADDDEGDVAGDGATESDRRPEVTAEKVEKEFGDAIQGIRLVYDGWSGKLVDIARWQSDDWTWEITRAETLVERQARQTAIDFSWT